MLPKPEPAAGSKLPISREGQLEGLGGAEQIFTSHDTHFNQRYAADLERQERIMSGHEDSHAPETGQASVATVTPAPVIRHEGVIATAIGALALGACAVGALAIGRLAIGQLALGRAKLRSGRVDELRITRLIIEELRVERMPAKRQSAE
jgi:hypothetical protein